MRFRLSIIAILLGALGLSISVGFLVSFPMDDWVMYGARWGALLGLVFLIPGILGLRACMSAGKAETADLAPPERSAIPLGILQARIAAGQCPKCGSQEAPAAQNCQWCGIDLAWAREHLDELAGREPSSLPEGSAHE